MRKIFFCFFIIVAFFTVSLYAQHTVNDINKHGGWFKVRVEILQSGNVLYYITQCYPSGEEYEIVGNEREKLPLYLKVLCMGMVEEGMKDSFDFNNMTFDENGFFMQMISLSFTLVFNFSRTESEILGEIGNEIVNKYRYREW
jgi:hypothetical protein